MAGQSLGRMAVTPLVPGWLRLVLWVLFLGPPAAALLQATGLPLVADAGWLARELLATYVCPTPARSYVILGHPMAVCARCWGATIGLWGGYLLFRSPPCAWLLRYPLSLRLIGILPSLLLWVAEIVAWPGAPLWVLLLNGAQAGLVAGLWLGGVALALHRPPAQQASV